MSTVEQAMSGSLSFQCHRSFSPTFSSDRTTRPSTALILWTERSLSEVWGSRWASLPVAATSASSTVLSFLSQSGSKGSRCRHKEGFPSALFVRSWAATSGAVLVPPVASRHRAFLACSSGAVRATGQRKQGCRCGDGWRVRWLCTVGIAKIVQEVFLAKHSVKAWLGNSVLRRGRVQSKPHSVTVRRNVWESNPYEIQIIGHAPAGPGGLVQ